MNYVLGNGLSGGQVYDAHGSVIKAVGKKQHLEVIGLYIFVQSGLLYIHARIGFYINRDMVHACHLRMVKATRSEDQYLLGKPAERAGYNSVVPSSAELQAVEQD